MLTAPASNSSQGGGQGEEGEVEVEVEIVVPGNVCANSSVLDPSLLLQLTPAGDGGGGGVVLGGSGVLSVECVGENGENATDGSVGLGSDPIVFFMSSQTALERAEGGGGAGSCEAREAPRPRCVWYNWDTKEWEDSGCVTEELGSRVSTQIKCTCGMYGANAFSAMADVFALCDAAALDDYLFVNMCLSSSPPRSAPSFS